MQNTKDDSNLLEESKETISPDKSQSTDKNDSLFQMSLDAKQEASQLDYGPDAKDQGSNSKRASGAGEEGRKSIELTPA